MYALIGLGGIHRARGRYEQAAEHYDLAQDIARETRDRNGQFEVLLGLGRLRHTSGHPQTALSYLHQALELATDLGQPADQPRAHDGLAQAHQALHQYDQARRHWQQALDILAGLGIDHTYDPETTAPAIQVHLAELDQRQQRPTPT